MTKYCAKCREAKHISNFGPNKARKDGITVYCRPCTRTYTLKLYHSKVEPKKCTDCGVLFVGAKNKKVCTRECWSKKRIKPISGYKSCEKCGNKFPYRTTLKVRSTNFGGRYIGSLNQKFCSHKCSRLVLTEPARA